MRDKDRGGGAETTRTNRELGHQETGGFLRTWTVNAVQTQSRLLTHIHRCVSVSVCVVVVRGQ